jgi:hypothetical protein
MSDRDHQLDQLHQELGMLQTALELFDDPPAQTHILTRVLTCITEYTQLVDGRLSAVIEAETASSSDVGRDAQAGAQTAR